MPPPLMPSLRARGVVAVLGPTNTGKTHYAIERMLAHGGGLIGLPLRLLAREGYARLVDRAGVNAVALVTSQLPNLLLNIIPLSVVFAILRYRLYDIDTIINLETDGTVRWTEKDATRVVTAALLRHRFGLAWSIPPGVLAPPVSAAWDGCFL